MGLLDSLRMGANALIANQAALQITGNNIANASTPGYVRQSPQMSSVGESQFGLGLKSGNGVQLTDIRRLVDETVLQRLRDTSGRMAQHQVADQTLSRIEALMNELTDTDLSSSLTAFFDAFSKLSQSPQDMALRNIVVQKANTLCEQFNYLAGGLDKLRVDLTEQLDGAVQEADRLAAAIADLNVKIVTSEAGGGKAASLRDQRDQMLMQLSELVQVTVREEANGSVSVFMGSDSLVYRGESRGLKLTTVTVEGEQRRIVAFRDNDGPATLGGGKIAGLQQTRDGYLAETIGRLDSLAEQLVWQVNQLHSMGTPLNGIYETTGLYGVKDVDAALNAAGLAYSPSHGSFLVTVTNVETGSRVTTQVNVKLDGLGDQTTMTDLLDMLNQIGNVSATIDTAGKVTIASSDSSTRISFTEDTSGVLAALGINAFFGGYNAKTMTINPYVAKDSSHIAAGLGAQPGDGRTAEAIAYLANSPRSELGGVSLPQYHQRLVADIAVWTAGARDAAAANGVVLEGLVAQHQSLSGVSLDEEAVNLMMYQRAFQGSARLISVVDELIQTLLGLV